MLRLTKILFLLLGILALSVHAEADEAAGGEGTEGEEEEEEEADEEDEEVVEPDVQVEDEEEDKPKKEQKDMKDMEFGEEDLDILLALLDANKDGKLAAWEYGRALWSRPSQLTADKKEKFVKMDMDGDNMLTFEEFMWELDYQFYTDPTKGVLGDDLEEKASTIAVNAKTYDKAWEEKKFNAVDGNKDGMLTMAEWFGMESKKSVKYQKVKIEQVMEIADADRDGFISLKEMIDAYGDEDEIVSTDEFPELDANNDNMLSMEEFKEYAIGGIVDMKRAFSFVLEAGDANEDGVLERDELVDNWKKVKDSYGGPLMISMMVDAIHEVPWTTLYKQQFHKKAEL